MTIFTDTWNIAFEGLPPDTGEDASVGASRIRQDKRAVRERMEVDHSWDGDADDGEHIKVTLKEQAGDPATQTDKGSLYTKDDAGDTELYYKDGAGNVVKMTENGIPTASGMAGEIRMWGGSAAPSLWLLCDGSEVSRSTYSALFAIVSTTFGVGNGSTTFNLPDFRGRSPMGVGTGDTAEGGGSGTARTLGDKVGAEEHTLTVAEMPAHTHDIDGRHTSVNNTGIQPAGTSGAAILDKTSTSTGGGDAHNNTAPALTVNFIIHAGV